MVNNDLDRKQSVVIDAMRFPLIVLVVFIHVLSDIKIITWDLKNFDSYIFISELISHNIARIAVPCFFLISGYLFFYRIEKLTITVYISQLKKKAKNILIPYLLWILFFIVVVLIKNLIITHIGFKSDWYYGYIKQHKIPTLFWDPINYPLWYLRDLFSMIIFSPIIFYAVKYTKYLLPIILQTLFILGIETHIPGLSIVSIAFFSTGAYFAIFKKNILEICLKIRWITHPLSFIFLCLSVYYNGRPNQTIFLHLFILFGIASLFILTNRALETKFISKNLSLSKYVFFIYVSHAIVLYLFNIFAVKLISTYEFSDIVLIIIYFSLVSVTIYSCILIFKTLEKYTPKILSFVIGGRISKKRNYG